MADMSASVRKSLNLSVAVMDFIPFIIGIIQPPLRPVRDPKPLLTHSKWLSFVCPSVAGQHPVVQSSGEERIGSIGADYDCLQSHLPAADYCRRTKHLRPSAVSFPSLPSPFFPHLSFLSISLCRNLEEIAQFPGIKRTQKQFAYAAKQLIAREVRVES